MERSPYPASNSASMTALRWTPPIAAEVAARADGTATCPTRASPRRSSSPLSLQRPLLLEGEAGVGKTEVAKVLAAGPAAS